jgi:hypothetical protein
VYISLPDTGDVDLIGTRFMAFSVWPCVWSCAAAVQAHAIMATNINISFFVDIAFPSFKRKLSSELEER